MNKCMPSYRSLSSNLQRKEHRGMWWIPLTALTMEWMFLVERKVLGEGGEDEEEKERGADVTWNGQNWWRRRHLFVLKWASMSSSTTSTTTITSLLSGVHFRNAVTGPHTTPLAPWRRRQTRNDIFTSRGTMGSPCPCSRLPGLQMQVKYPPWRQQLNQSLPYDDVKVGPELDWSSILITSTNTFDDSTYGCLQFHAHSVSRIFRISLCPLWS